MKIKAGAECLSLAPRAGNFLKFVVHSETRQKNHDSLFRDEGKLKLGGGLGPENMEGKAWSRRNRSCKFKEGMSQVAQLLRGLCPSMGPKGSSERAN